MGHVSLSHRDLQTMPHIDLDAHTTKSEHGAAVQISGKQTVAVCVPVCSYVRLLVCGISLSERQWCMALLAWRCACWFCGVCLHGLNLARALKLSFFCACRYVISPRTVFRRAAAARWSGATLPQGWLPLRSAHEQRAAGGTPINCSKMSAIVWMRRVLLVVAITLPAAVAVTDAGDTAALQQLYAATGWGQATALGAPSGAMPPVTHVTTSGMDCRC